MLLQTIVQLHILITATPALAGWALGVPPAQAIPAHVFYLTAQKSAESVASASVARSRSTGAVRRVTPALSHSVSPDVEASRLCRGSVRTAAPALHPAFRSFPHAPRAP